MTNDAITHDIAHIRAITASLLDTTAVGSDVRELADCVARLAAIAEEQQRRILEAKEELKRQIAMISGRC